MADTLPADPPVALPASVRLFPLDGVILCPGARLPLHIFEPRYRQMIRDALDSDRMIAMIQPSHGSQRPDLHGIGGLGQMIGCEETADGRFLILLYGVSRFQLVRELPVDTPYRQAEVDYAAFADDGAPPDPVDELTRARLKAGLRKLLSDKGTDIDWVDQVDDADLVNRMASLFPFTTAIRQALLEAPTLRERAQLLGRCMQFGPTSPEPDAGRRRQ